MREIDRQIPNNTREPEEMLLEARDRLIKCRQLFILSTLMLMFSPTAKKELVFWGNIWFNASLEEKRITRELVVPAKLATGAFRTVPVVEDRVRANASSFAEAAFILKPRAAYLLAGAIVNPHINFTKEIQEEMGVPENPVYTSKTKVERKHAIFGHKPTPKKVTL